MNWIKEYEHLWLFVVLTLELAVSVYSAYMLRKEYDYDKQKDDKRARRKTTRKTTTGSDGSFIEEQTVEEIGDLKKEGV